MNTSKNKPDNKKIGHKYEDLAIKYIESKGWNILSRNFRYSNKGEIDIIAQKNDIVYFFEVKYRKNIKYGHPLEAVNKTKQTKILKTIIHYIMLNFTHEPPWTLQTIAIYGEKPEIEILDV